MKGVALVGGGLANGLIALRLKRARPRLRVILVERSERVGGCKTWSFHDQDVTPEQRSWLEPLVARSWPAYRVRFPGLERRLGHGYHSIRSATLHAAVQRALGGDLRLGQGVEDLGPTRVVLAGGQALEADCVIDGRGLGDPLPFRAGYQKFLGVSLRLREPLAPPEPMLMDATLPQRDGFRFVYTLPWSESSALVEDTCYADTPALDPQAARRACLDYAGARGWTAEAVEHEEAGVLPIPLDGDFAALRARWPPGVPGVGTRAGLFHPTTGYSLPDAVRTADALAALERLETASALELMTRLARGAWERRGYFRLLNRLLFEAADPPARYKVLRHFYRMPDALIGRFYADALSALDRMRILSGRPPLPLARAAKVLAGAARFGT